MIPVITEENFIYYVDETDFLDFIVQNSDYEYTSSSYNKLCAICRDEVFNESGKTYFTEKISSENYSEFAVNWINLFYDAHPFMQRIMFVFNN